jgi:hypothetical protein
VLDFGWMLSGAEDMHFRLFARGGLGDVRFQVEMVLAASGCGAGEFVGGGCHRGLGVPALHVHGRHHVRLFEAGVFDGENCREVLVGNFCEGSGVARGVLRGGGDDGNGFAVIGNFLVRQKRFTGKDGAGVVFGGDVGGGEGADHARGFCDIGKIEVQNIGVGAG